MPIVFVHGVNTRLDFDYLQEVKIRDNYLRELTLPQVGVDSSDVTIINPYWGGEAAKFAWNHASLPASESESFGAEEEHACLLLGDYFATEQVPPKNVVLFVAKRSLTDAVDLLWSISSEDADETELRQLSTIADIVQDYLKAKPSVAWLDAVSSDQEFVNELLKRLEQHKKTSQMVGSHPSDDEEQFGISEILGTLKNGLSTITNTASRFVGKTLGGIIRPSLHRHASLFLGDVFVYLNSRGDVSNPGPIPKVVIDSFQDATASTSQEDKKVIIIAHSMGGNIAYDVLTHFLPNFHCDVFVTIGSQVGMFEELKLFKNSDTSLPSLTQKKVKKPSTIDKWLNVYDTTDFLGYAIEPIIEQTHDFNFSTGKGLLGSHSGYFSKPSFYARLGERLKEVL